jgi:hypothetical protein
MPANDNKCRSASMYINFSKEELLDKSSGKVEQLLYLANWVLAESPRVQISGFVVQEKEKPS